MKKVIFFTELHKLHEGLDNFNLKGFSGKKVPVKLHMGEIKNKYFPKPDFVKPVINKLKEINAEPFLFDTTVAYPGLRSSKAGYEKVANMHGFTQKKVGCNVVIDDTGTTVTVEGRSYDVADTLYNSSHIFAISHVKGHVATGFGGAIKNFGMGGVTRETKRRMHNGAKPVYQKDACTYCGICAEVCPFNAIKVKDKKWDVSSRFCFGCGVCVENCTNNGLEFQDANLQYVLACSAKACVNGKNVIYLNEVKRIADSCDCDPTAKKILCPDIGYLISDDPVAVDKASLDLIHNVKPDVFQKHTSVNPFKQIKYGEEIGLGSSSYQLIEI